MRSKHIEWVLEQVQKEIDYTSDQMIRGNAADFADYRRGCGVVTGLRRAREILLAAIDRDAKDEGE